MTKVLGEIKEGPKSKEGLMKEKGCEWTNMSGSWLSLSVYSSDSWGLKKGSANNPVDVKGLGEEAFSDKRGTDAELYVRKGKSILEVRTSAGSEAAKKAAELASQTAITQSAELGRLLSNAPRETRMSSAPNVQTMAAPDGRSP